MQCAVLLLALMTAIQAGQRESGSLFVGAWTAKSATIQLAVAGDTLTITHRAVSASGQEQGEVQTFQTDGKEHTPEWARGTVFAATWVGSRILEIVAKRDDRVIRVTYEVSADGKTLTRRVPLGKDASGADLEQVTVFDRK